MSGVHLCIWSARPPVFTERNQKCTIDLLVKGMMVVSLIGFLLPERGV